MNHLQKIEKLGINPDDFDSTSYVSTDTINVINPTDYINRKVQQLEIKGVHPRPVFGTRSERDKLYALENKFKTLALQPGKNVLFCKTVDDWADLLTELHEKHQDNLPEPDICLTYCRPKYPLSFDEHQEIGAILKRHIQDYNSIMNILEERNQSTELNLIQNEILRLMLRLQVKCCNKVDPEDKAHGLKDIEKCYWD